jgi:hypothetical protein
MLKPLLWKEWRQLALVRWGGLALGALLPVAIRAIAGLAQRGVLPAGSVAAGRPRDLMFELLPATLALGVWPLIALMSASQSFAGDRAAGTESFLVERPVPRSTVWWARLLASSGTLAAVIVSTAAIAAGSAALTGAPPGIGWSRWEILVSLGFGVSLLGYLGGVVAASLLASPMGALLLGVVLGALPAVLAAELSTFIYAQLDGVALGPVVPVLLLPAYLVASWLAFCRGEPAGRGRLRRSVSVLAATLAGVVLLFVLLAPAVLRVNAGIGQHALYVSPKGGAIFVASMESPGGGGGWIADTATATKRSFVPPPIQELAWSPDGSEVAFLTWSGPLGSVRPHERIDVRSTADGSVLRSLPVADEAILYSMTWADAGLVTVVSRDSARKGARSAVEIVDPQTGAVRETGFQSDAGYSMRTVGPTGDRQVFVRELVDGEGADGAKHPVGYSLRAVDVAAGRVGPAMADASGRQRIFAGWGGSLSLSGRFARLAAGNDDSSGARIVDLRAGVDPSNVAAPPGLRWIDGDRFVWQQSLDDRTRMFIGGPGASPRAIREWRKATVGIDPSPDGRAVFISVIPTGGATVVDASRRPPDPALFAGSVPAGAVPEELVYYPAEDRFTPVGAPFSDRANDRRYSQWAGPKTLARLATGVVYFEDIDAPGQRRFVVGGPRDLE